MLFSLYLLFFLFSLGYGTFLPTALVFFHAPGAYPIVSLAPPYSKLPPPHTHTRTGVFAFVTEPWRLSSLSTGATPPPKQKHFHPYSLLKRTCIHTQKICTESSHSHTRHYPGATPYSLRKYTCSTKNILTPATPDLCRCQYIRPSPWRHYIRPLTPVKTPPCWCQYIPSGGGGGQPWRLSNLSTGIVSPWEGGRLLYPQDTKRGETNPDTFPI